MTRNRWIWLAVGIGALALVWSYSKSTRASAVMRSASLNPPPAAAPPPTAAGAAAINAKNMAKNLTPPAPVQKLLGFVGL